MPKAISRRSVLAGLAGVTVGVSVTGCAATQERKASPAVAADGPGSMQTLAPPEIEALTAIVARLIPSDGNGPGAAEAGAVRFIDHALGDALAVHRVSYANGLASIDRYARAAKGVPFCKLSEADQDKLLQDLERGDVDEFVGDPAAFFALLRDHTIQGTFSDPYYGGNVNYIGWDLIGYPGLRMMVTREDQRMDTKLSPVFVSAYADDAFHRPVEHGVLKAGKNHGN